MENKNFNQLKKVKDVIDRLYNLNSKYRRVMENMFEQCNNFSEDCATLNVRKIAIEEEVNKLLKLKLESGKTIEDIIVEISNIRGKLRSIEDRRKAFVAVVEVSQKLKEEEQFLDIEFDKLMKLEVIND